MAQANFLRLHWTEEAVRRTNADPRRQSFEYAQWEKFTRAEAKAQMWDKGYREIPYASEVECQEQAVRMADHFSRLFMRTVRTLNNHRLAKAKLKRLSLPAVRRSMVEAEHRHVKGCNEKLTRSRRVKS